MTQFGQLSHDIFGGNDGRQICIVNLQRTFCELKSPESLRFSAPFATSFSRGLSDFGKSLIFIFNIQNSLEFSRHPSLEKQGSSAGERRLRQPEQRVCASLSNRKV